MTSSVLSRRQCLRALGAGAAAMATTPFSGCAAPPPRRGGQPNVVFILADDLGHGDLGCYGATDLQTPNIDALATEGTHFTQFYVTAPACMPSRISFLTGRHYNYGVEDDIGMASSEVTLAEMFGAAGYRTALFGKWHMGVPTRTSPNNQGFDEFLGFKNGAMDNYSHYYYWGGMNRHVLFRDEEPYREDGVYFPDIVVRESTRFIEENRDVPFFLFMPFNMPHYPLQAPDDAEARFAHISDPLRRQYASCAWALDERVGQVVECLEANGLREDTIIIFASDHGPSNEERGGGGSAGALRGYKATLWEGGIRVPFILSWPGSIPQEGVRRQPVMSTDILPTLAAFTGVPLPQRHLDGRDLAPVISSATAPAPRDIMHWTYQDSWAVREGPWKLTVEGGKGFLVNLEQDPGEWHNLGDQRQDLVQRFVDSHNHWMQGITDRRKSGV
jgi:arylsulfatase A